MLSNVNQELLLSYANHAELGSYTEEMVHGELL